MQSNNIQRQFVNNNGVQILPMAIMPPQPVVLQKNSQQDLQRIREQNKQARAERQLLNVSQEDLVNHKPKKCTVARSTAVPVQSIGSLLYGAVSGTLHLASGTVQCVGAACMCCGSMKDASYSSYAKTMCNSSARQCITGATNILTTPIDSVYSPASSFCDKNLKDNCCENLTKNTAVLNRKVNKYFYPNAKNECMEFGDVCKITFRR